MIYDTLCFFLRSAYVYLRDLTTIDNARRQLRYTKIDTCLDLAQPLTAALQEHKRGECETKGDLYSKKNNFREQQAEGRTKRETGAAETFNSGVSVFDRMYFINGRDK